MASKTLVGFVKILDVHLKKLKKQKYKIHNISYVTVPGKKGPCRASFQNRVITTIGKSRL